MHIDATPPEPQGRAHTLAAKLFAAPQLHALDGIHMGAVYAWPKVCPPTLCLVFLQIYQLLHVLGMDAKPTC